MTPVLTSPTPIATLTDWLQHLGGVAPDRIRFHLRPGPATEQDVLDIHAREGRLGLVEHVLVEKALRESGLTGACSEV